MLAIIKRKLAALSIHINDSMVARPSLNDRLMLLAKMQEPDSVPLTNMVCQRCSVGAVYLNGMLIVCGKRMMMWLLVERINFLRKLFGKVFPLSCFFLFELIFLQKLLLSKIFI